MTDDIIDLGDGGTKYTEIADALLGKDVREKTDLDIKEINAMSFLDEVCEKYRFVRISKIVSNLAHYRMSLKRSSRAETVDVFRSLMREKTESKQDGEEEMLK